MKLGGINRGNLEQIVGASFFNKIKNGLNRVKQSTFNQIVVYSLAGVFGGGVGYGCEGGDSSANVYEGNDNNVVTANNLCAKACANVKEDKHHYFCLKNTYVYIEEGKYEYRDILCHCDGSSTPFICNQGENCGDVNGDETMHYGSSPEDYCYE